MTIHIKAATFSLALGSALAASPVLADQQAAGTDKDILAESTQSVKDAYIIGRLNSAYALNEHLSAYSIDVDSDNARVTLTGTVKDDIAKDLAVEIAHSVDEVKDVDSQLNVAPNAAERQQAETENDSFGQTVQDASLTAKVKSKLLLNDNVGAMDLDVDTENQVVTLSGKVETDAERNLAGRIAENTSGVEKVENNLVVASR